VKLIESIGQFEQLILVSVMLLEPDAYGMEIYSKVCELADREMSLGSIYVTLGRLQRKGYVASKVLRGSVRGGKPRKYYRLLTSGERTLWQSVEVATRISEAFWKAQKTKPS
jgi:PadR family transcriptional regulator, regulatory protein PadR